MIFENGDSNAEFDHHWRLGHWYKYCCPDSRVLDSYRLFRITQYWIYRSCSRLLSAKREMTRTKCDLCQVHIRVTLSWVSGYRIYLLFSAYISAQYYYAQSIVNIITATPPLLASMIRQTPIENMASFLSQWYSFKEANVPTSDATTREYYQHEARTTR